MTADRFDIFEDVNGQHYVLLEPRLEGIWLAFIMETASLCYRSNWNLQRMKKVGRAGIENGALGKGPLLCHCTG